jgi:hypothetical protein
MTFHFIYGMSSFPLTPSFFRGLAATTNQSWSWRCRKIPPPKKKMIPHDPSRNHGKPQGSPSGGCFMSQALWRKALWSVELSCDQTSCFRVFSWGITIWLFNIAMENGP